MAEQRLSSQQASAVSRIGGLILVNAMVFQEVLSEHDKRVLPLQRLLKGRSPL